MKKILIEYKNILMMFVIDSYQVLIYFFQILNDDELTYCFLSFIISFNKNKNLERLSYHQVYLKNKTNKTFINHWYFFHKSFLNIQLHHINPLEMLLIYHLYVMIYYTFLYNLHIWIFYDLLFYIF